jgi:hypothetical protein
MKVHLYQFYSRSNHGYLSFFLIARTSFIYEHAQNILEFITILGAATAFFASSVGLVQNDLACNCLLYL